MKFLVGLLFLVLTPLAAFAAEEGSVEPHMMWRIIDFIIFAGIIYYYTKKPIVNFFKSRKDSIKNAFEEAEQLKKEAEDLLKETEEKLSQLEDEMKKMFDTFTSMAEKEKENIIKETEDAIKRIRESIEEEKVFILNKAKLELLSRLTKEAINNVKDKLSSISADEHSRINKKFTRSIAQ
jgi:F-type H+-transporting ATPase subunit b